MEFSNGGASVYHHTLSLYAKTADGTSLYERRFNQDAAESSNAFRFETRRPGDLVVGLVQTEDGVQSTDGVFQAWFSNFVVNNSRIHRHIPDTTDQVAETVELITRLFESNLLNQGPHDQWLVSGRQLFKEKTAGFVSRQARVECCLPAFPCKSSNPDKVSGFLPDKGEEIALRNLHQFARHVESVYPPGAKVWIVSDGHVFSDCIGVDDDMVDTYSTHLIHMNRSIAGDDDDTRVGFLSLWDLFFPDGTPDETLAQVVRWPHVYHPVKTRIDSRAELCREILLAGCGIDPLQLRSKITGQDPALVSLYRGFSKFMLEDLSKLKVLSQLSRSQCRKLSVKVAFEMIQRNQAYSNLIELLFPMHVRLSIHSHNNAGPKLGINLLPVSLCSHKSFYASGVQDRPSDLLHIPTPWHNSIFQVDGDPSYYVAKLKAVQDAMRDKPCIAWVAGNSSDVGGYYRLTVT